MVTDLAREAIVAPLIKLWPVILGIIGASWQVAQMDNRIDENAYRIQQLEQQNKEWIRIASDRNNKLGRIEAQLDVLLNEREKN